jgi:hypothetical protein
MGEIYRGKHGASLKLDGLEKGINSNARERAVNSWRRLCI